MIPSGALMARVNPSGSKMQGAFAAQFPPPTGLPPTLAHMLSPVNTMFAGLAIWEDDTGFGMPAAVCTVLKNMKLYP